MADVMLDDVALTAEKHGDKSGRGGNNQLEEREEWAHFV